jgi:hypothetical protein
VLDDREPVPLVRVFLYYSKVSHLLRPNHSPNDGYGLAYCGASPQFMMHWYGTGNQNEIDRAVTLPLCKRCLMLAPDMWRPST